MKKIILLFIIGLVLINFVSAGNEMVDYLSSKIYTDCQNEKNIGFSPVVVYLNRTVENLYGKPVTLDSIKEVLRIIIDNEPYDMQATVFTTQSAKSGINLFYCGNKSLDANFNTYRWNGERVDPFSYNYQNIEKYVDNRITQIANINRSYKPQVVQNVGDNNTNQNNQYNIFSDNNFYLTIGLSIGLSLISITLFEIGLSIYRKRKNKQISKKEASQQ